MPTLRAERQHIRRVNRQMIVAFLAHQIPQPHHFATVIHAVVIQILEDFTPFQLGFVGNIRQFLLETLFNHPQEDAIFLALFVAHGELFQIASDSARQFVHLGSR